MNWVATLLIAVVAMSMGLGAIAIITEHFQRLARIHAEGRTGASNETMAAIGQLRAEIGELRDTATKFDLSFDTALQRLESRVAHLEGARSLSAAAEQRTHVEG